MSVICVLCDGTGLAFPRFDSDCPVCNGRGQVESPKELHIPTPVVINDDCDMANALCDLEDCSDWEANFAESIYRQVRAGRALTDAQKDKGQEILERHL